MKPDKFFDAMGEINEEYIVVKLRIPRLHMNRQIALSIIVCFAVYYLLSRVLFALLLPDITSYPLLEGQIRQLAILIINASAGVCSAPILRRYIKREDFRSYVVFFAVFFLAVLAIGYMLLDAFHSVGLSSNSESLSLLLTITRIFPEMFVTAFAAPAPIAQFITVFILNRFCKKT